MHSQSDDSLHCIRNCNTHSIIRQVFVRCSPQGITFRVTGACSVNVSSVLYRGVYVHSVSFWLRSVPSGFYRLQLSTDDQLFKSNVFQLFIHNPAPVPSAPQPVSNIDNSRSICRQYLTNLLTKIGEPDPSSISLIFQADHVFNVTSPITNSQGMPLSDLYFKTVPNFLFEGSSPTSEELLTMFSSEGNVSLLSFAPDENYPIALIAEHEVSNCFKLRKNVDRVSGIDCEDFEVVMKMLKDLTLSRGFFSRGSASAVEEKSLEMGVGAAGSASAAAKCFAAFSRGG